MSRPHTGAMTVTAERSVDAFVGHNSIQRAPAAVEACCARRRTILVVVYMALVEGQTVPAEGHGVWDWGQVVPSSTMWPWQRNLWP